MMSSRKPRNKNNPPHKLLSLSQKNTIRAPFELLKVIEFKFYFFSIQNREQVLLDGPLTSNCVMFPAVLYTCLNTRFIRTIDGLIYDSACFDFTRFNVGFTIVSPAIEGEDSVHLKPGLRSVAPVCRAVIALV